jgi:hypothetical protein
MYITFPLQHKINKKSKCLRSLSPPAEERSSERDWKSPRRLKQEMREKENGNLKGREKIRVKRKLDGSRGSQVGPMRDRASG